ncbi:MAG: hypothetical protein E7256_00680 [Lachnospiraceae bacterium]|nr:hypothetical protein [Lachnospiraceae bacterium]
MRKYYRKIALALTVAMFIGTAPVSQVRAASSLKLYNYTTSKSVTYTDKQITYQYNGNVVSLAGTPGILSDNGVALASVADVFSSAMGLSVKINKAKKTVTVTDKTKTLVMTIGSKKATLNGKTVTMNAAPVSMKYVAAGKSIVLVPTRFVADTFGYGYVWNSTTATVSITKAMNLYYDGAKTAYTGALGNVTVDGASVDVSNMPSILISNTAMVQAWRVFAKNMGVTYKENKTTGELTFTKGNITVKMTPGSTVATINGKQTDCGVSPKRVKNEDTGVEVILVPGSFLAKALGYDYTWDNTTKTSVIVTTKNTGVTPQVTIATPTPTKAPSATATPTKAPLPTVAPVPTTAPSYDSESTYYSYSVLDTISEEVRLAKAAYNSRKTAQEYERAVQEKGFFSSVKKLDGTTGYETYVLEFANPSAKITTELSANILSFMMKDTIASDGLYFLGGKLADTMTVTYDPAEGKVMAVMQLANENMSYDTTLSEDGRTLTVRVYPNYVTGVTAGKKPDGTKYYELTTISEVTPEISEDSSYVYMTVPYTANAVGEQNYTSADYEDSTVIKAMDAQTVKYTIKKPSGYHPYQVSQDENVIRIYFEPEVAITDPSVEAQDAIVIPLPSSISETDIADYDYYLLKKIVFKLPGDQTAFYKSNPITSPYSVVKQITTSYDLSSNTTSITLLTTKIQGYKMEYVDQTLRVIVADPDEIYSKIVVLDAGHGGNDPGTYRGTVYEKNIVAKILITYAQPYFESSDIKAYYTRLDDTYVGLYDRAAFPNEVKADFFVSLHIDSASGVSATAKGTSVYYSTKNTSKTASGLTSKLMASLFVNNLVSALGTNNRGVKTQNFVVVRETKVPAVLIELAFISNDSDYNNLISTSFQKKTAQTIYNTVSELFEKYPTGR